MLNIHPKVMYALEKKMPVVALESTVIAHGLPYPENIYTAQNMETTVKQKGAVPATIAILEGKIHVGLEPEQIEQLGKPGVAKVSLKDISLVLAEKGNGATTVAATVWIAHKAGIQVFATGGIGGIHPGDDMDWSSDLPALATIPVAVVCSGPKAILDLRKTREWFETWGVPILGYETKVLPAFYCSQTDIAIDRSFSDMAQAAELISLHLSLMQRGILIAVPVPKEYEISMREFDIFHSQALEQAKQRKIQGAQLTPFLMEYLRQATSGATLIANTALLLNNAKVAAELATALCAKSKK